MQFLPVSTAGNAMRLFTALVSLRYRALMSHRCLRTRVELSAELRDRIWPMLRSMSMDTLI